MGKFNGFELRSFTMNGAIAYLACVENLKHILMKSCRLKCVYCTCESTLVTYLLLTYITSYHSCSYYHKYPHIICIYIIYILCTCTYGTSHQRLFSLHLYYVLQISRHGSIHSIII